MMDYGAQRMSHRSFASQSRSSSSGAGAGAGAGASAGAGGRGGRLSHGSALLRSLEDVYNERDEDISEAARVSRDGYSRVYDAMVSSRGIFFLYFALLKARIRSI
jgi:hypothetical protein